MGWANRITVARGALAIVLWALLHAIDVWQLGPSAWWSAFALFVVTAATDSLDGYVARRRGEVSAFGRIADPFVDKLLILGSMIFLIGIPTIPAVLPPWTVAVVLARELLVTALRGAIEGRGGNFQAGPWGKAKMLVQCIAIGAVLLHGAGLAFVRTSLASLSFTGPDVAPGEWCLARAISVLSALVTMASGVEYWVRAAPLLRAKPPSA
jgi:CDP-diacylglycerol--glycerol-3-phosphate 3-phosphatidyltransferase